MKESEIQSRMIRYLEKQGYLVVKIIQTTKNGWPDIQAHKDGQTIFIEVKSHTGKVSELQHYRHQQLRQQNFNVIISSSLTHLQNELTAISQNVHSQRTVSNSD